MPCCNVVVDECGSAAYCADCEGVGHYDCVSELTLVAGDIKHENIVFISSKADTVLAVSGQSNSFALTVILLIYIVN